jgi:putative nucleotidyltransferase with HDIG domain
VREAVIRLGTGIVAGFALGSAVRPLVQHRLPGYNLSGAEFWQHSLMSAFAAESIQAHASKWSSPLAFTAGLLHDVGKLVLGKLLTREMAEWLERAVSEGKQPLFRAELEILSLHHGDVGGIIAQHWGLPDVLVGGIINHHTPAAGEDPIADAIYLADLTAHRLRAERSMEPENPVTPSWEVWDIGPSLERLGMTEQHLQNVLGDARKRMQDVAGEAD